MSTSFNIDALAALPASRLPFRWCCAHRAIAFKTFGRRERGSVEILFQSSMSCFLVAVETAQLNLQALSVNKGKMLVFSLFLWKVVQAEGRNRGTTNIQLCVFKLPYSMYSMPKVKLTKNPNQTKKPQKSKIQEVFNFYNLKKKRTQKTSNKTTKKPPPPRPPT